MSPDRKIRYMLVTAIALSAVNPALTAVVEAKEQEKTTNPQSIEFEGHNFKVVQQPKNQSDYISPNLLEVTEFIQPKRIGNIGLLAHNYLEGEHFYDLQNGEQIKLKYDDKTVSFTVDNILEYQNLGQGKYKDLKTGAIVDRKELFKITYGGAFHLTLQTCLEKGGNLDWGLHYVLAQPKADARNHHQSFWLHGHRTVHSK